MEKILIVFEIIIAIAIVYVQVTFFLSTLKKINELAEFFPAKDLDESYIITSDSIQGEIQTIRTEKNIFSLVFIDSIESINKYLRKNEGAADFTIIKSIVERNIETKESAVISNITLPLYIGLMGTFIGIILGLLKIGFGGGVTENNINSFIGGVVIAMVASFFGLLLTVINNAKNYKEAKRNCDERKNNFYNFLQVELLPHLGSSLVDALDRMKNNINDFNYKFENNIQLFDNKFSSNIISLKNSVELLSENIGAVVDNSKTQKEFLVELRKIGYNRMAEANTKVFTLLKETGPTFIKFIEKQKELNISVEHAISFANTIENIFDRVKNFEESINNLGENINSSQYLGNEVLKRIDYNLTYLDKNFDLLKRYEDTSSIEIENYFKAKYYEIQKLTDNIKREVESAFDVNIENNPFQKLNLLKAIDTHLSEINAKLNSQNDVSKFTNNQPHFSENILENAKISDKYVFKYSDEKVENPAENQVEKPTENKVENPAENQIEKTTEISVDLPENKVSIFKKFKKIFSRNSGSQE